MLAFTVSNANDSGSGSLRAAIDAANSNGNPTQVDEIVFSSFFNTPRTIALSSTYGQLTISESLKITGPGSGKLTIVGYNPDDSTDDFGNGNGSRVIEVAGSGVSATSVEISGVTIMGGDVSGDGGGILAHDTTLYIHDALLLGNHAQGSLASGGGLAIRQSAATLSRVEVRGNSSDKYGGGIDSYNSDLTINDHSIISLNNPDANMSGNSLGGGIFFGADLGTLGNAIIEDTIVSGNRSSAGGGGISVALSSAASTFLISRSIVELNEAVRGQGGGISAENNSSHSGVAFQIRETEIRGNRSGFSQNISHESVGVGGGVYLNNAGTSEIYGSTISCNLSSNSGGGVAVNHTAGNVTISNSTIANNAAHVGGGIIIGASESTNRVDIRHSTIAFNTAKYFEPSLYESPYEFEIGYSGGGGISGSHFKLDHSIVANNSHVTLNWPPPPNREEIESPDLHYSDSAWFEIPFTLYANHSIVGSTDGVMLLGLEADDPGSVVTDPTYAELTSLFSSGHLEDNGGVVLPDGNTIRTLKIDCDSIARDAGDPSIVDAPEYDQRGEHYPRETYTIDIGAYELGSRDFPSLAADFDDDGDVDGDDLQIWKDNYGNQSALGDANSDEKVDHLDLQIWQDHYGEGVTPPNTVSYGDFNGDNVVDGQDFLVWQQNFGKAGGLLQGDANGDGIVDGIDFLIWQRSLGQQSGCEGWTDQMQTFFQFEPGKIVVSTLEDVDDGYYGLGGLSLREAIYIASQNSGADEIVFADALVGSIVLTSQLTIGGEVTITGPGANALTLDGNQSSRVFMINSGADVTISGLTITGGYSNVGGGAIYSAGDLMLDSVTVSYSEAGNGGGGIYSDTTGKLTVKSSTFHHNDSGSNKSGGAIVALAGAGNVLTIEDSVFYENEAGGGGAVFVMGNNSGTTSNVSISNTTVSTNTATGSGGALAFQSYVGSPVSASIINSTIAYNSATGVGAVAGGIFNVNPDRITISLHNTILAENSATTSNYRESWGSLAGTVSVPSSYNLIGWGATGHGPGVANGVNGNQVGTVTAINPLLAPLGDYGGKTKTHALKAGSPALDKGGDDFALASDQRGYNREFDMLGVSNAGNGNRDIGAYEAGEGTTLIVRSDDDRNDSINDRTTVDSLRLREALALSAALAGTATITFDQSGWVDNEIQLEWTWGELSIASGDATVLGPGADALTITAAPSSRVFDISTVGAVILKGMRITGGNVSGDGGGLYIDAPTTLDGVQIDGNSAGDDGGAIYLSADGELTIRNSSLWNNTATGEGGGLYVSSLAEALVLNSTFSENIAGSYGGGIYGTSLADIRVVNATIAHNVAASGSGVYTGGVGKVRLDNTIVAHNGTSGTDDIVGAFDGASVHNLIGVDYVAGNGIDNADTNLAGGEGATDPINARLSDLVTVNGLKVYQLLSDSLAIDHGEDDFATEFDYAFDQIGQDRIVDYDGIGTDHIDSGTTELQLAEV